MQTASNSLWRQATAHDRGRPSWCWENNVKDIKDKSMKAECQFVSWTSHWLKNNTIQYKQSRALWGRKKQSNTSSKRVKFEHTNVATILNKLGRRDESRVCKFQVRRLKAIAAAALATAGEWPLALQRLPSSQHQQHQQHQHPETASCCKFQWNQQNWTKLNQAEPSIEPSSNKLINQINLKRTIIGWSRCQAVNLWCVCCCVQTDIDPRWAKMSQVPCENHQISY